MIEANKIYSVKEIFLTLQGEGYNAGTPAVFCRFSGCNLWNGIEKDRKTTVEKNNSVIGTEKQQCIEKRRGIRQTVYRKKERA